MHYFLEWDPGQCNPGGICLEFDVAPWSIFKSLMCFLRTSVINWIADFWKSVNFEGRGVKSFCIINSLSQLPFFLSLFSSSFSSGEDWSAHGWSPSDNLQTLMKVFGFIAVYVWVAILYDSVFLPWVNLSLFQTSQEPFYSKKPPITVSLSIKVYRRLV